MFLSLCKDFFQTWLGDRHKHFIVGMRSDLYAWICFKLGERIDTIVLYILILTILIDPVLDSKSHEYEKARISLCQSSKKAFIRFE